MREILFRGKMIIGKEWSYGDLSYHVHDGEVYVFPGYGYDSPDFYEVDSTTVGQYTGLHDSTKWDELTKKEQEQWLLRHTIDEWKGKPIFEGDILKIRLLQGDRFGSVEFFRGCFYVKPSQGELKDDEYHTAHIIMRHCHTRVIGNIHDNPELLGGEPNAEK